MKSAITFLSLLLTLNVGAYNIEETDKLSNPFNSILMADSQLQNLLAPPHILRTKFIDSILEIAVRAPHQDMFSVDTLKWSLKSYGKNKKIIYLGDALNIGCKNEWSKFTKAMNQFKVHSGWVMAPGNHDFFYYGNSNGARSREKKNLLRYWWAQACSEGPIKKVPRNVKDVALTKDNFIRGYIKELNKQALITGDFKCSKPELSPKQRYEKENYVKNCSWESKAKDSFLQKVHYVLPTNDQVRYSYKSLIVQEIKLSKPGFRGILLDTTDYENGPTLLIGTLNAKGKKKSIIKSLNAGLRGSIQKRQIEIIKSWLNKTDHYFLMGHHPFKDLDERSKKLLTELKSKFPSLTYVSAHTHNGFIENDSIFPEINIGSMTDHTPEFIEWGHSKGNIQVKRIKLTPELLNCNLDFDLTGKPMGYLSYKNIKGNSRDRMFDHTMNVFHHAYQQVFELNSFWEGSKLKDELDTEFTQKAFCPRVGKREKNCQQRKYNLTLKTLKFDKEVQNKHFSERVFYGACQAIWAAKAESSLVDMEKYNI
ncbi:MAG: hypothetical protein DRQ88_08890 [Epsilonproteobacteria bacterium]|nr:MAG: hypothetical protein DRQ89_08835 [Campylobacterota bacterium]RLA65697.1 MAG: hypothetical protein DRQ88_08890 [Campylobacterota bacterium]